jgi:hypothetical protein
MFSISKKGRSSLITCGTICLNSISALLINSTPCLAFRLPVAQSLKLRPLSFQQFANTHLTLRNNLRGGAAMSSMSNQDAGEKKTQYITEVDAEYPGTAVQRLKAVHARVAQLTRAQLDADWPSVRRSILWAGNLPPSKVSCFCIFVKSFFHRSRTYYLVDRRTRLAFSAPCSRIASQSHLLTFISGQEGCVIFRTRCRGGDTLGTPSTTITTATSPPCSTTSRRTRTAARNAIPLLPVQLS